MEIVILKKIKVMLFNKKYTNKFILIFPQNLIKISLDILHLFNRQIENYVLVMKPTMLNQNIPLNNSSREF